MLEFFKTLLSSRQSMTHGHCYLWQPELASMHVLSNLLIALAYYSIPAIPIDFVGQCRDVPLSWIFLFGALVISCDTGHQMEVWNLWYPQYWLSGGIKAITAGISAYTALEMVPLRPKALVPSPAQLEAADAQLETELRERPQVQIREQESEKFLPAFMTERLIALLCWTLEDGKLRYQGVNSTDEQQTVKAVINSLRNHLGSTFSTEELLIPRVSTKGGWEGYALATSR